MKKLKLLVPVLLLVFILLFGSNAFAQSASTGKDLLQKKEDAKLSFTTNSNTASLNGKKIQLSLPASDTNSKMLVPVKLLCDTLGAQYTVNPNTKTCTISKDRTLLTLQAGNRNISVDGKKILLDTAPLLVKSTFMVPVKALSEKLDAKFSWSEKSKTATITTFVQIVVFPDKTLENAIRKESKKSSGPLLYSDIQKIYLLHISDAPVSNLEGIQLLSNLSSLTVRGAQLSDITPLASMTGLQALDLSNNQIRDISPLSGLKKLLYLDLSNNFFSDVSPLKDLKNLNQILPWGTNDYNKIAEIQKKVADIVNQAVKPGMSDLDKELALHDYIITHAKYDQEGYKNHTISQDSHDAAGILEKGIGVCDGYAEAMQLVLNAAGIDCRVITGNSLGPKDPGYESWGHAWNLVKINGQNYHLDATFDDPVNENGKQTLEHTYFNLSDKQMAVNHTWNRANYPPCSQDSPDFYSTLYERRDTILTSDWYYVIAKDTLYRVKPDGTGEQKLCDDAVSNIELSGEWIYYCNLQDDHKLYKIKTDGTSRTKVLDEAAYFPSIINDSLYYIPSSDEYIYKAQLDGSNKTVLTNHSVITYFLVWNGQVFYRAFDFSGSPAVYRVNSDGSSRTTVISNNLPGFTLTSDSIHYYRGNFEIYQNNLILYINGNDGNKIYQTNFDGTARSSLNSDSASEIDLCGDWVYYINTADQKYYRVKLDGSRTECIG